MSPFVKNPARWSGPLLSVLRIVAAFMFIAHGTQKLWGFPLPAGDEPHLAHFFSEAWLGGVLEVFGGGLVFLGLFTRPVAFVLSGMMAVAYFQFHAPRAFLPIINKGELAVMYCFVW